MNAFRNFIAVVGLAAALGVIGLGLTQSSAEEARAIPAPAVDTPAGGSLETVTLAGGCFWGVQGVFQHVEGVTSAVSGYAGGAKATATYRQVSDGDTGHAEAVRVTYDPKKVSFGRILQVYFSVAHDPTTFNRQGPDVGQQYRSAIFVSTPEQARVARAYVRQLDKSGAYRRSIVTKIEEAAPFYPAEAYHQDYMVRNPDEPYIVANDAPKVAALKRLLPELYRARPALVAARTN